jgi:hypothetical protein
MPWGIVYYKQPDGTVPAEDFLDSCPAKVEALIIATLEAVRDAPPPQFSGGGKWEAMHGEMRGYHEIRATGPGRRHYRLFCLLDNAGTTELRKSGFKDPQIVAINGMVKPNAELFTDREYKRNVRDLGDEYKSTYPRRIAG